MTDAVRSMYTLATMSGKFPLLASKEREARLELAQAIMAWDAAELQEEEELQRHTAQEQAAVNTALTNYGNALAALVRGEE